MSNVTEVSSILELDLTGIPENKITRAKKAVGNYLVNEILRSVGNGKSPVEGEANFKKLDKKYAKKEHGGRRLAKLELDGDMLSKLKPLGISNIDPQLKIGIFKKSEAQKADGHNQLSEEAKLWAASKEEPFPKRRFIPATNQKFKNSINEGIGRILDDFRTEDVLEFDTLEEANEALDIITKEVGTISAVTETPESVSVEIDDLFSDEVIEGLLIDELRKQGRL